MLIESLARLMRDTAHESYRIW